MKKQFSFFLFPYLCIIFLLAGCKNNAASNEITADPTEDTITDTSTERLEEEDYLCTDDLDHQPRDNYDPSQSFFAAWETEKNKKEVLYPHESDTISLGIANQTITGDTVTHLVGIMGRMEKEKKWLTIKLISYDDVAYGRQATPITKTGITDAIGEDWLGDTITLLKGFEEECIFINIAYKGYSENDFEYIEQTEVTDKETKKALKERLCQEWYSIRFSFNDTLRLRAWNCIQLNERTIYLGNYKNEDDKDVIFIIENDKVQALSPICRFYAEVFFYKLRDTVYMHLEEDDYATHVLTLCKLNPNQAYDYEMITSISKTTD